MKLGAVPLCIAKKDITPLYDNIPEISANQGQIRPCLSSKNTDHRNNDEAAHEKSKKHVRGANEVHGNLQRPGIFGYGGSFHYSCHIFLALEYASAIPKSPAA
ncbi:hypothetical protein RRF57_007199 [Xylaria bambusicola]|uniref:Uncharacterized protein n=1 Tax=Xylaria bambusicola TaxID=326684 RepID=A0AAN7UFU2_9PEZI